MTDSKATARPWELDPEFGNQAILGPDGFMVADCAIFSLRKGAPTKQRCTANADLIVKAVNHHDELVEMLDRAEHRLCVSEYIDDRKVAEEIFFLLGKVRS